MTLNETMLILENERECIYRSGTCDKRCDECFLRKSDYARLDAFNSALDWLRKIQIQKGFENV